MPAHKTIGVIGLGSIGMRHAKNLLAMGHRVVGFDLLPERAAAGGITYAANRRVLFDESEGVVIATPSEFHMPQIIDATDYANMSVFVEKPIGASASDLMALEEIHARGDRIDMVGNNLRFHSCVKQAKQWLDEGLIGTPLWGSFTISQFNDKYTDPVILNWGAHEIDLAHYLLGPATVTSCVGNDRLADLCLLHQGGVPSTIHMDYLTKPEQRTFHIQGDKGRMIVSLPQPGFAMILDDGEDMYAPYHQGKDDFDQSYKDEMQAFIDLIDGKPVPHAATGEDGLRTLETILEAQKVMVAI